LKGRAISTAFVERPVFLQSQETLYLAACVIAGAIWAFAIPPESIGTYADEHSD